MFELEKLSSLKGAVSGSCSTVGGIRAAVPVKHWAAASRAVGFIRTALLALGQRHEFGHLGVKGAVSGSCSTVIGIRAAEPVGPRAATSRTTSLIRVTLLDLSHFHQLGLPGLKGAVSGSGSTVGSIRAAIPVGHWAAASRAVGLIRATLLAFGHLHQLGFPGLKGAVKGSGSTDGNIITAEPMGFGAATSRAIGPTRTLVSFAHLHQLGLPGLKGAVSGSGSTEGAAVRAAVPIRHWAATSRAVGLIRTALLTPGD